MPLLALFVFVVLAIIALIPISIIQRFRVGTARRQARGWVAALNMGAIGFSVTLFLISAYLASRWVPEALAYTLTGLGAGAVLGVAGLALTRWEHGSGRVYYTPNRWLVLAITVVVAARVGYGFWRTWEAWRASVESMAWVAASGAAASMSAGAVVLGYYLVYWAGVRARVKQLTRRLS